MIKKTMHVINQYIALTFGQCDMAMNVFTHTYTVNINTNLRIASLYNLVITNAVIYFNNRLCVSLVTLRTEA